MKKISSENAPKALGPYSQAIQSGDLVFVSGQLPINPETDMLVEGISSQTEQSIKNIESILSELDLSLEDVVKTTCFLSDMSFFVEFNKIYSKYFTQNPARSCFAVKELPKKALCEIEVIAELSK